MNRVLSLSLLALVLTACASTAEADLSGRVQAFDDYPVVWLGPSYDVDDDGDLDSINSVRETVSPAFSNPKTGEEIKPAFRIFRITYGECAPKPCATPIQLTFFAPCANNIPLSDAVKAGTVLVRGVPATVMSEGNLWIETKDFTLKIFAAGSDPQKVLEKAMTIASQLEGANEQAASLTKSTPFSQKPNELCGEPPEKTLTEDPFETVPENLLSSATDFWIDVDGALGTQATRQIALGSSFNLEVGATASAPWEAYQTTLHYDDAILDAVVPNPDQTWSAQPIADIHGGNRFLFSATPPVCTPSTHGASVFDEDDAGDAYWAMTCTEAASGTNHTGDGALVQFTFKCEAPGTANLTLTGIDDTFLLDSAFTKYASS